MTELAVEQIHPDVGIAPTLNKTHLTSGSAGILTAYYLHLNRYEICPLLKKGGLGGFGFCIAPHHFETHPLLI